MYTIDDKEIRKLERDLKTFASRAFPFASKATINGGAFMAQKTARKDIEVKMVTRNRFTVGSVRVEQTRTLNVNRQIAVVGSIADYMADQEFGGINKPVQGQNVAIPTAFSAGQYKQQPRTKLPRRPNKLANIQLRRRKRRAKTNKQALLFKVQDAVKSGNRYIYHDFGGGKSEGIFKVIGGRKSFKRGWPQGAKLRMVYDTSRKITPIPKNPWLKPAVDDTRQKMPAIYVKALRFQLKRQGIF